MTTIKALVEGGKTKPAPPLGPQLSAMKLDVKKVIDAINEKTKDFAGIQVPIEININPDTKEFEIKIGTPPVASLIKKELKIEKLAKTPFKVIEKEGGVKEEFTESLTFDQVVKIAKVKMDDLKTNDFKKAVKEVVSTCVSCGVYVENKPPKEIIKEIDEGKWDGKLNV